jgi:hypothetical protein
MISGAFWRTVADWDRYANICNFSQLAAMAGVKPQAQRGAPSSAQQIHEPAGVRSHTSSVP